MGYEGDFARYSSSNFATFKNYANELRTFWNKRFYGVLWAHTSATMLPKIGHFR